MNTAAADAAPAGTRPERRPAAMPAIIAIVLIAILALMVLGICTLARSPIVTGSYVVEPT